MLVGNNYAEYYANKNRGLLQSSQFLIKSVTKITRADGAPSALDIQLSTASSSPLPRNEMKMYAHARGRTGEKWPPRARS